MAACCKKNKWNHNTENEKGQKRAHTYCSTSNRRRFAIKSIFNQIKVTFEIDCVAYGASSKNNKIVRLRLCIFFTSFFIKMDFFIYSRVRATLSILELGFYLWQGISPLVWYMEHGANNEARRIYTNSTGYAYRYSVATINWYTKERGNKFFFKYLGIRNLRKNSLSFRFFMFANFNIVLV